MALLTCFQCGHKMDLGAVQVPGRRDECEKCRTDLHVCRNCRHYDPKSYNECREPQSERVQEKERSNFCDYFEIGQNTGGVSEREKLLAAADALFKKK
jgi:hypothetical protein